MIDALLERKVATKPPTRWRNWWRSPEDYYWQCKKCGVTGFTARGTVEADHCLVYPSKDLAVTAGSSDSPHYVGAYPEGERPCVRKRKHDSVGSRARDEPRQSKGRRRMSGTIPTVGAYYEIGYPFIREAGGFAKWKPGCRWDRSVDRQDRIGKCDAIGTMIISVKGVYTPPGYPTRVFFVRRWIDPSGVEFGHTTLRCYALGAFTYLAKGFKHPFEIAPMLTVVKASV